MAVLPRPIQPDPELETTAVEVPDRPVVDRIVIQAHSAGQSHPTDRGSWSVTEALYRRTQALGAAHFTDQRR